MNCHWVWRSPPPPTRSPEALAHHVVHHVRAHHRRYRTAKRIAGAVLVCAAVGGTAAVVGKGLDLGARVERQSDQLYARNTLPVIAAPEPGSLDLMYLPLLVLGAGGLIARRRKRAGK